MKKLLFHNLLLILLIFGACQSKKVSVIDYESEKAKIEKIARENFDLLIKGDKQELVKFIRKYNLPKFYSADQYIVRFENFNDSTDEAIGNEYLPSSPSASKLLSFTPEMKPIIKVTPDGKMAYYLGKELMKIEYDSLKIRKQKNFHLTFLEIFEKQDSVWQMGDVMQAVH